MGPVEVVPQMRSRHVCVDLGRDGRRVAQVGLHVADVDSGLDEVRAAKQLDLAWSGEIA